MLRSTILELIAKHATHAPDRIALTAPQRCSLSYGGLHGFIQRVGASLNRSGVGRGDVVAVVLPTGPELATVVVAMSSYTTVAPLDPRSRRSEFEFYFDDLDPRALVISEGEESCALDVAMARRIDVITLQVNDDRPAGVLELSGRRRSCHAEGPAEAEDIALMSCTSDTSSCPTITALTHANLTVSAGNMAATLALTPADRCLNVLPLFHSHGLMAAFASWHAGASVSCTPGFHARRFFEWLADQEPTWYTAVPAMHRAVSSRAYQHVDTVAECRLRFIASMSAPLPPQVIETLSRQFDAPVIETDGPTETAAPMGLGRDRDPMSAATEYVAPDGDIEEWLAEMWARVLGVDRIGTQHRFLDVGGDSLLATQLVADIRAALDIDMTILDVFEGSTIAKLARIVEQLLLEADCDVDSHLVA